MIINLSEITTFWVKDHKGWNIAPAGISWVKEGYRIKVGDNCIIGDGCTLGDWCIFEDRCTLGNWCTLGKNCNLKEGCIIENGCKLRDGCMIGSGCKLGIYCKLGDNCILEYRCTLGNWCLLGNDCKLGSGCILGEDCVLGGGCTLEANATDPIDLGFVDGYRKCIANVNGVAYIGAGCRWFTLQDAIKHWEKREDRLLTRALMEYAKVIANHKGWAHN